MMDQPVNKAQDKFMMDEHKLFWHLDRVREWQEGKRIAPLHIDFGITTGCNMACTYCYGVIQGRTGEKQRYDMPKEAILRFLKDAKEVGVRSIAFIGEGENTLNPALPECLTYAREIGLDCSLATNGMALPEDDQVLEEMLRALVWIRFNISAASDSSFKKIHRVDELALVRKNIDRCVKLKKEKGLEITIGMQMVLVHENVEDIVPLAQMGRDLDVDYLVIKPCSDSPDKRLDAPTKEYLDMNDELEKAEALSTATYNVVVKWQKVNNSGYKDFDVCHGTEFLLGISGSGAVFPCGHWFNIRSHEFIMGNIVEQSFKDILKSEKYWQAQQKIKCVNVHKECESNCRQYYISKFLYKLKNVPDHVNFI